MSTLPTFIVNDVIKMPDVDSYVEEYKTHLNSVFAAA
jgi:modulator of drug activity B